MKVAVLGGGISGLTCAWQLSKLLPSAKISLMETTSRWGGWLDSRPLFETGPRTLRTTGFSSNATLDLIHQLKLTSNVIKISPKSPGAQHRYLLYQGKVLKLPSSLKEILNHDHPAFKGLLWTLLKEPFIPPCSTRDESIHDFITRRFNAMISDSLVSAIVHGIYAGDHAKLSIKSTLSMLWDWERTHGSVSRGLLAKTTAEPSRFPLDPTSTSFIKEMKQIGMYSFQNGIQTLSDRLVQELARSDHVECHLNCQVNHISFGPQVKVMYRQKDQEVVDTFHHVVSALPSHALAKAIPDLAPTLTLIPNVHVAVINLAFKGSVLPVQGFGYLVPKTEQSKVLGCVFDSQAVTNQGPPDLTRLTFMMGGHRFHELFGPIGSTSDAEFLEIAIQAARDHLGIVDEPVDHLVSVHENCIPQYHVGHEDRLNTLHQWILNHAKNQLSLIGASYRGVSVNDCIENARHVAHRLVNNNNEIVTGLEAKSE